MKRESGKPKRLRIGVVGLTHGASHVKIILNRDDMDLVALCDIDEEKCRKTLASCAGCDVKTFNDYPRMLSDAKLDAIVIATPLPTHAELSIMALEKDIHVLLEKPLASNIEEAFRIKEAASRAKCVCQIGYRASSSPLVRKILQLIKSGELGEIVMIWAHLFRGPGHMVEWRKNSQHGAGQFFDCMVHEFNDMFEFAGADFSRVCAFGAPLGKLGASQEMPDTVSANIEFQNGVRASAAFSQVSATYRNNMFGVVGTKGRVDVDPYFPEGPGAFELFTDNGLFRTKVVISKDKASSGHIGFSEQYDFFVKSIEEGAPVICDVGMALKTQRLMEAFNVSIKQGRTVARDEFQ
ncbi:MAG: Gfo/Idh/MocA family oxidoreductase [Victivallales bacterium]|nr:Gfo/Idh/MocA family oxidoreductase [Victivallales bacterium]